MTAPPMKGYIEAQSKDKAQKMMAQHKHFVGYHNGANTVTLTFVTEDTEKVREYINSVFRPNEGVREDGTVVRRDEEW